LIISGSDNVRLYWNKYFNGAQAVIFVVDSASSEESMKTANAELHKALADPELDDLPLLVLGNHQDKEGARTKEQVRRQIYTFRDHTAAPFDHLR
jgi:ADP-ribosylation factor-like protein 15